MIPTESLRFSRREILFVPALAAAAAAGEVRCTVRDASGNPLAVDDMRRLHLSDLLTRAIPSEPQFAAGEARFTPPPGPFRIGLPTTVPGFGQVVLYADKRGAGYTAADFSRPLALEEEFANDRLAAARKVLAECRQSGWVIPQKTSERIDKAAALLGRREYFPSLAESLWAGEELVFERAKQSIAKNGPRPGFLFGCNAFSFPRLGRPYAERFEAVFNYATVPFYLGPTQPVEGKPNYGNVEKILSWTSGAKIIVKGHPLVWFYDRTTPAWLREKPKEEAKRIAIEYARDSVRRFRDRIHVWDVINEAHSQNSLGFSIDEQIEMTGRAARAAHEADPTCFRVVNSCCTWGDYMARKPRQGQQNVYDYLAMVRDAKVGFEAIGLQYYYAGRDMLEIERNLETFSRFGKPVHITELGLPSSSAEIQNPFGNRPRYPWHGDQWTETAQADWAEQFYTMCYSKPWIEAITWWDFNDPAFIPHGGLTKTDLSPKESYLRIEALIRKWRSPRDGK